MDQIWWTSGEAAKHAGVVSQTIRNWGKLDKIPSREVPGRHGVKEYLAAAVLEVSAKPGPDDTDSGASIGLKNAALANRNVVLEEVLRRYRWIDEQRAEIDRWHREIEELLQGLPPIPNN